MTRSENSEVLKEDLLRRSSGFDRFVVAIAGPPGAGKSTLAHDLALLFAPDGAKVAEMDGFHYDNAVLDILDLRSRKGAPETFDYRGFFTLLQRLRNCEPATAIPLFDRPMDLARAGAAIIKAQTKFIFVEGNYLLLDEPPWDGLASSFDCTIFLDVPREVLRLRLLQRWLDLGRSEEQASHWVETNDMPNIDRVLNNRLPADITL